MLDDACENKYDKVILISSDGDFIPLVKRVKSKGKIVEVCYFKNCVSKELLRVVDEFKIIDKKILRKFFLRGWRLVRFANSLFYGNLGRRSLTQISNFIDSVCILEGYEMNDLEICFINLKGMLLIQ